MSQKFDLARFTRLALSVAAAENTRCACGDTGSWEHAIAGTSGMNRVKWAGCPRCRSAIGAAIDSADVSWYFRQLPKHESTRREALAYAAAEKAVAASAIRAPYRLSQRYGGTIAGTINYAVYDERPGCEGVCAYVRVTFDDAGHVDDVRLNGCG